ncbi:MAG TPA: ABC transporter permease [Saprospiraceae bacterium]|nr:ABC transporter permease [Saprospiraceae bacterium]
MRQNKALALLQISGLSIGVAASILLAIYINGQWKFDRFHQKSEQIVRINAISENEETAFRSSAITFSGMGPWVANHFQEVKSSVRLARWIANDVVLRFGENVIRDDAFLFVDSNFLEVFSFQLIEGNAKDILSRPNTIVLTQSKAKAFFGEGPALGKTILFDGRNSFLVTGVLKDPPKESHIQFSALCPITTIQEFGLDMYKDNHFDYAAVFTYLVLDKQTPIESFGQKLNDRFYGEFAENKFKNGFEVQSLTDIHMDNEVQYGLGQSINGANIFTLLGISFLILAMCWINHFNLFTAETFGKTKPLSIRRIIGADRKHVFNQLAISALLTNLMGIGFGILLAVIGYLTFKNNFDWNLNASLDIEWSFKAPPFLIVIYLVLGTILSTVLPAIILSAVDLLGFLQPKFQKSIHGMNIRKALLIFQFSIMIALTSFGILIYQQTKYAQKKPLSINLDDVTILRSPLGFAYQENQDIHFNYFYEEMKKRPEVENVGFSTSIPGQVISLVDKTIFNGKDVSKLLHRYFIAADFFETFQFQFLGKSETYSSQLSDKSYGVINESAMRVLGIDKTEDIIGKTLINNDELLEIVGVVKDHHQLSIHHPKQAILYDFRQGAKGYEDGYYAVKYGAHVDLTRAQNVTKTLFHKAFPFAAFDTFSAKEFYQRQYQDDQGFLNIILIFIGLSFLIGCFGMIGISMIEFDRRTKEVAIRKTLGASIASIIVLLFKNIMQLTIFANVIAVPIAFYFMFRWLRKFSYRVDISWQIFASSAISTLLVIFLVLINQAKKTASLNPVNSLKRE